MLKLKKSFKILVVLSFIALLLLLVFASYEAYDACTQMVVEQQQHQLLVVARAVSQNLSLYISEQIRDVDILVRTPGFLGELNKYYEDGDSRGVKGYILSYMLAQQQGISRIYLLDRDGEIVYQYSQYPFLEEFDEERLHLRERAEKRQTEIGSFFRISDDHYGLTLTNTILDGNSYMGSVVCIVNVETLYQRYVASLNTRGSEYITVKNHRGTVIMHPDSGMLGFNYLTDIEGLGEDPQYSQLYDMLTGQYENEEGSAVFRDYTNDILPARDEIIAYSRMNYGGVAWYISAAMPLEEAMRIVLENMGRFGLLVASILALIFAAAITIYGLQKNRQKLQMEANYLRDINHTLEELHESRREVRHYQKLQTLGALAGSIAHEFNNLLTPIIGYSEFLKTQLGEENPYYEDVDEIYKAGVRGKEIVEQILPFSRRESESVRSIVSLHTIVMDVARMMDRIKPSNIVIQQKLMESDVNILANATQIHQVLMNLCTNAFQAMEKSGGTLTVSTYLPTQKELSELPGVVEGNYVGIAVEDEGCGMPQDVIAHIFDPFFTTKSVGEGTGLGLSVAKRIITSHRGFICVRSTLGQGSSFRIYLPISEQMLTSSSETPAARGQLETGMHLMIVDDDGRIIRYLQRSFSKRGVHVEAFQDAQAAVEVFSSDPNRWSAVVLDYMMPKCKGAELALRIKALRPNIPIVLITGVVEKEALELQQEKVISDIVVKPVDADSLLQKINQIIQSASNKQGRGE